MSDRRTVITGAGPVSSIGTGYNDFVDAVRQKTVGTGPVTLFELPNLVAGEIADFDVEDYLESPKAYLDRSSELAFAAMSLAMEDAGLDVEDIRGERTGLVLGSAFGSMGTMELFFKDVLEKAPKFAKPFLFPHTYSNTAISLLAIEYGITGPHLNFASGYVSAANAIAAGYDIVRAGHADIVFAGGYESLSEPLLKGLTSDNSKDFVPGEGAGIVVLEELEHALAREAHIHAEPAAATMHNANPGREQSDIDIRPLIGETMGAGAALHVIAALDLLANGQDGKPVDSVLVNTTDPGGAAISLTLRSQAS